MHSFPNVFSAERLAGALFGLMVEIDGAEDSGAVAGISVGRKNFTYRFRCQKQLQNSR